MSFEKITVATGKGSIIRPESKYEPSDKQKIYMKTKRWKQYSEEERQQILKRYEVVLTDHETRQERFKRYDKGIWSGRYVKKGLSYMDKGFEKFDEGMKAFDAGMQSGVGKNPSNPTTKIFGSSKTKTSWGKSNVAWSTSQKKHRSSPKRRKKSKKKKQSPYEAAFGKSKRVKI